MILKVKEFQEACKSILEAVDTTTKSILSETLELKANGNELKLNVSNKEYFVGVTLDASVEEDFVAAVNAKLFLSLIAKITTDEVEITTKDNALVVKGNGLYKIPLVYFDGKLAELEPITIDNPTVDFVVSSDILLSIYNYNRKELSTGNITKDVQSMYYVDEQGAITFTKGACVNSFTLAQPVKILLTEKLVKLFKLFAKGTDVQFTLGYGEIAGTTVTTLRFISNKINITSRIVDDEDLLVTVPVNAIRSRANNDYVNSINVNRVAIIEAIDRLLLFAKSSNGAAMNFAIFDFGTDSLTISGLDGENKEFVDYVNTTISTPYSTVLDIRELEIVLDSCKEDYLTFHFGDGQAIVIARGSIKNVVPEVHPYNN